jgi:hypothetical protein
MKIFREAAPTLSILGKYEAGYLGQVVPVLMRLALVAPGEGEPGVNIKPKAVT